MKRTQARPRHESSALWTIVLAAGEGSRLRPLTQALYGEDLPKQFATLHGRRSLLQATLDRTLRFSPPERTVLVVAKDREKIARDQVEEFGDIDLVAQPKNVGTGPGILLPLSRVMKRDPDAIVAVIPSDHYVSDARTFAESVTRGEAIARSEGAVVLVAAIPEGPETQYGWIVPDAAGAEAAQVAGFVEKPPSSVADELFGSGALWNTFIMVGPAQRFWELGDEHLSPQTSLFTSYRKAIGTPVEHAVLSTVYERMAPGDFSKDVLERSRSLRVTPLASCGWSDWGTPERVLRSLHGTSDYDALIERMAAGQRPSGHSHVPSGRGASKTATATEPVEAQF